MAKLLFCFIKNVHENSAKRIAFQLNLQEISVKWAFLPIIFRQNLSQIFSKIPAKSAIFSVNLSLKIQRNLTFFQ